mmetsp:Transcript_6082/g.17413  ORF Transcript_6082/g.17413 Transcript_6082/m.17413 type:complete len:90 (-) Transcript_6082:1276-1545(-)
MCSDPVAWDHSLSILLRSNIIYGYALVSHQNTSLCEPSGCLAETTAPSGCALPQDFLLLVCRPRGAVNMPSSVELCGNRLQASSRCLDP